MARRPDAGLRARAAAAQDLLTLDRAVDHELLLSYVVWPTAKLEQAVPRTGWTDADRERVFGLAATGLNAYAVARELGRPRSTVAQILRKGARRGSGSRGLRSGPYARICAPLEGTRSAERARERRAPSSWENGS